MLKMITDEQYNRLESQLFYERNKNKKLKADLDYVCMMTDVDIPEEEEDEPLKEV